MIDHIEILKDERLVGLRLRRRGDVVNIITKTTQDGGDLHVTDGPTQHGGGDVYPAKLGV